MMFAVLSNSCFSPYVFSSGEESEIYDQKSLARLSRVVVLPLSVSPYSEISKVQTGPLSDSLWKEIDAQKVLSLAPMDSVRLVEEQFSNNDTLSRKELSKVFSPDAFIKTELIYVIPPGYGKTYTATLMMVILDANNWKPLAYFSFDTFKGKTYIGAPRLEKVTSDAIKGVSQTLAKNLNKLRGRH